MQSTSNKHPNLFLDQYRILEGLLAQRSKAEPTPEIDEDVDSLLAQEQLVIEQLAGLKSRNLDDLYAKIIILFTETGICGFGSTSERPIENLARSLLLDIAHLRDQSLALQTDNDDEPPTDAANSN